ncbi:hypothetical protein GCM10023185_28700 [Hymenobacter saemangeumensis]|uniref:Uncharacterized protein n=1 Tax=Hymenobacter saemangeumensis TaxID=1084522 RepID=A0ABP8IKL3_9BACT
MKAAPDVGRHRIEHRRVGVVTGLGRAGEVNQVLAQAGSVGSRGLRLGTAYSEKKEW